LFLYFFVAFIFFFMLVTRKLRTQYWRLHYSIIQQGKANVILENNSQKNSLIPGIYGR
jgi:hypothetical protein